MAAIAAAHVITPTQTLSPGVVDIDESSGAIVDVAPTRGRVPDLVLAPGFVDIQINGIDDVDVAHATGSDWERLDALLTAQGTTSWCPTLVTAPLASYGPRMAAIAAAQTWHAACPSIVGAHLEGPFLGGAPGAHRRELIIEPDLDWIATLPDVVILTTLAPEASNAVDAIKVFRDRGVVVSLGHSTASAAQSRRAAEAGARLVTHLYNGMGALHDREPGLLGTALTDDRLTASIIADLVHVHPTAIRLAFAAKPHQMVLVTDAVAWRREAVGDMPLRVVDGAPRLADGTLAGSVLTMDGAVAANVVKRCGVTLEDAIRSASTTPAALLGLHDRGTIEIGRRADLVALDDDLRCVATWVGGTAVHG